MKRPESGFERYLSKCLTVIITCFLLGGVQLLPAHAVLAPFSIATGNFSMNFAFDGTNYLVGLENHATSPATVGAQMLDASGNKVGGLITIADHYGISVNVAFDGSNYLMIWENDPGGTDSGRFQIYGQFISKAGTTVGSPFAITTQGIWFNGIKTMAFGGGRYLVTYTRLINPDLGADSTNRYIAGRMVNPDGSMGDEFSVSSGYGNASDVAFDGSNFFVVWTEDRYDYEIRGRFVSPAGVPGTEISVNASSYPSDNPKSVTFDGTKYMVIWNDEVEGVETGTWDVFGQQVTTDGTLSGNVIPITTEAGPQLATTISFDGTNYLATWVDMSDSTNWNLYGQYISASGTLIGSKITISAAPTNQMGGAGFTNGNYLALINNGVVMGSDGDGVSSVEGAYGLFITPISTPAAPTISSLSSSSGTSGSSVIIYGTNFVAGGTTVSFNGTLSVQVTVTNAGQLTAEVPSGATSGPIKVITAGGSATSTDYTIVPAQVQLTISFPGTGSGTVKSTSPAISCLSPDTCYTTIDYGTPVTLSTLTSLGSTFDGWGGICTNSSGDCSFTMNSNTTVTATFTLQQNLKKGSSTYYGTMKSAFASATNGDLLLARMMLLPDLTNDATYDKSSVAVTLRGGFTDTDFSNRTATDFTSVTSPLTIKNGTLVLDQITVK